MKKNTRNMCFVGLIYVLLLGAYGGYFFFYYNKDTPKIIKPLADPLLFNNGTEVETAQDWDVRRTEIKEILLAEEYGHIPDRPDAMNAHLLETQSLTNGSKLEILLLSIIPHNNTPSVRINFTIWVFFPDGKGPFPTLLKVAPDGTGSQIPINQTILSRGYIFVCFNHTELDLDTSGYDIDGPCQLSYPEYDWGSLAVWAWGAMRVADYLLKESWVSSSHSFPDVDPEKLIITGHSRRGKTAVIAGAFDERFAMVVPNGSGCGGVGSFLIQQNGAETIASITNLYRYKSWFQRDFNQYAFNEEALPFDQHFLRSLVAPRLILSTDGMDDRWANPMGTQAMWEASNLVFTFLNVIQNNALHFREGGHGFLEEDFLVLLDFADKMLINSTKSGDFYMRPFDFEVPYL